MKNLDKIWQNINIISFPNPNKHGKHNVELNSLSKNKNFEKTQFSFRLSLFDSLNYSIIIIKLFNNN